MYTADLFYRTLQYIVNKAQGGYLKPSDGNLVMNQGSNSYFDFLLGEIKERKTNVELWMNRRMRSILSPLIDPVSTLSIDGSGFASNPSGYELIDAMYTTSMDRIRFVQQNSLYSYLNSTIDPIAINPVYIIENGGFRIYPNNIGSAKISFVKKPPIIIWNFTNDANGRPVYNPTGSVDPIWGDTTMLSVISRSLKMVGINLQAGMVEQYANDVKENGQ